MQRLVTDRLMRAGVTFGFAHSGAWRVFPPMVDDGLFPPAQVWLESF